MPRTDVLSPAPSGRPCAPAGSSPSRRSCAPDAAELGALLGRPRDGHRIGPDGEGRVPRHRAAARRSRRSSRAARRRSARSTPSRRPARWRKGPAAMTARSVPITRPPPGPVTRTPRTRPPVVSIASTRPATSSHPVLARPLEQVHAELLAAEPAAAARVQDRERVRGEVREVAPDQRRLRDHVGAGQRRVEPVGGGRLVAARRRRVLARRARRRGRRPPRRRGGTAGTRAGSAVAKR